MKKAEAATGKVYVVLTRTGTRVAKMIRMYTREPYSHVSLSFDENLDTLYSFARRHIHNPLNAGFIEEHIDSGIFGMDKRIDCAVYCLEFPQKEYRRIYGLVQELLCHKEEYSYNFVGLLMVALNRPWSRPKQFFCSEFVAWVLGTAGLSLTSKEYALMRPEDFRRCLSLYQIYEGKLHEYVDYRSCHRDMDFSSIRRVEYLRYPEEMEKIVSSQEVWGIHKMA